MNNPPSRTPRSLGTRRAGPAAQQQQGPRSAAGANAAMLRLALQRNMNWTAAWWNGHDRWWAEQDAAGLREPIYRLYDVPQRRPRIPSGSGPFFPPGFSDSSPPPPPVSIAQRRLRRFELLGSGVEAAQQSLVQLQAAVEAGRGNVGFLMDPVRPTGLRLRKILGKGGQGVVALFEVRDGNVARGSRRRRKVVIKGPIWNDASTRALLTKEKDNVLVSCGLEGRGIRQRMGRPVEFKRVLIIPHGCAETSRRQTHRSKTTDPKPRQHVATATSTAARRSDRRTTCARPRRRAAITEGGGGGGSSGGGGGEGIR